MVARPDDVNPDITSLIAAFAPAARRPGQPTTGPGYTQLPIAG